MSILHSNEKTVGEVGISTFTIQTMINAILGIFVVSLFEDNRKQNINKVFGVGAFFPSSYLNMITLKVKQNSSLIVLLSINPLK